MLIQKIFKFYLTKLMKNSNINNNLYIYKFLKNVSITKASYVNNSMKNLMQYWFKMKK